MSYPRIDCVGDAYKALLFEALTCPGLGASLCLDRRDLIELLPNVVRERPPNGAYNIWNLIGAVAAHNRGRNFRM